MVKTKRFEVQVQQRILSTTMLIPRQLKKVRNLSIWSTHGDKIIIIFLY